VGLLFKEDWISEERLLWFPQASNKVNCITVTGVTIQSYNFPYSHNKTGNQDSHLCDRNGKLNLVNTWSNLKLIAEIFYLKGIVCRHKKKCMPAIM
jgi:hypothetical protein